jgi:lipoprotein NlpD
MKVRFLLRQTRPMALWCAAGLLVAGCAAPANRAPVEDRARAGVLPAPAPAASSPDAARPALPGADNTGKAGYYTIRPGDTMVRIGLENGQNWRDIARWNGIENPNLIEVGQVLRVVPPGTDPNTVAARAVPPRPLDARPLDGRPGAASAPVAAASAPPAPAPAPAAAREPDDDIAWQWPASGPVATTFDEARSKGLAITGRAGDPVLAAADGRVVYAGSGLRGYGNLVIVKHNATYLTAYAHNRTLLVKEDQSVKRGQKIAEMGASDAERVQLHFEIRKQGKPVDPARLLPPR